ncbi:MAG TPA: hypothetical protein VE842_09805 [Pyrinomonadaceae bacterium]|jgi:hypothetical protein|nr:hypothetical protein [Pyrinomonadaceae bacterium]
MFGKKSQREPNERLDGLASSLLRASASNEAEAEAVASSPFLYTRLRMRIAAERARREEGENWLAMLGVIWRAVPGMALAAVFAFVLFWSASPGARNASGGFSLDALLGTRNAGIEQVVFADKTTLSNDEVLATILNEDEREASR